MKKNNTKNSLNTEKGSVLIFSLFIMMISLVIGISLMTTSTTGRRSTLSSTKSVASFQVADSGIEYAYSAIRKFRWDNGRDLQDMDGHRLDDVFSSCSNGIVDGTTGSEGETFTLYFYSDISSTTPIDTCSGQSATLVRIKKIKSVGDYNGITRAVEVQTDFSQL